MNMLYLILEVIRADGAAEREEKMWHQEMYETGSGIARKRSFELRKLGYKVSTSNLGRQVTEVGLVNTTMITVYNPDDNLPLPKEDFRSKGI